MPTINPATQADKDNSTIGSALYTQEGVIADYVR